MSIVSSYISSRAPVFKINVQASTFMDHILAIVAGLGVRIVIDVVDYEDHRLTGSLIGLWEGVVVQHFIKKSPKSFDPYVAYALRVFIDFLFTESLIRLVLTFLFTGMGIVFADIAPRVWADSGLRRFWRHLRRDLYTLVHSVPSIPYFARPRTVRFSPSRAPSVITSVPPSPSVITIAPQVPIVPVPRKRPVPGSFPDYVSETDTDLSIRSPGSDYSTLTGHTRNRRPTVQTESETSYDPDEGNRSSSGSGTSTPILNEADLPDLPNIEDEDVAREVVLEDHKDENTPRPPPIKLPPTPSDTTYPVHINADEPHEVPPLSAGLPQIPDDDEDWENISRREVQATPLPRSEDESTSSLLVEPKLSTSADQQAPASSTPLISGTQLVDVPSGDTRQPEALELDPYAEQPLLLDGVPAAISTSVSAPPPVNIDHNGGSNFLVDLDICGPPTQVNDSRPPSYAQLDRDTNIWSDVTGKQGGTEAKGNRSGSIDIWGDVMGEQGGNETEGDGSDIDDSGQWEREATQPTTAAAIQESGEQQASATAQEVEILTPAPPKENAAIEPSSIPENTTSMTMTAQQDGTTSSSVTQPGIESSAPQFEGTTPNSSALQPVVTNPESSTEQTSTKSSDTQQVGLTDGEGEQPALSTSTPLKTTVDKEQTPGTAGQNLRSVNASTLIEESFPEKHIERLDKSLELRNEIVKLDNVISRLQGSLTWSKSSTSKEGILAEIKEKEEKLDALREKARRWYEIASEGKEEPPTEVDLSAVQGTQFGNDVQTAITLCLLKNIRKLTIALGSDKERIEKARKTALTNRLDQLNLTNRAYHVGQKEITITLPISKS